ncbi:permease (plasmid) [Gemmatirosa kalamazoonensis]|uniref:Permease n=1 Tax=Gemmatirosa kalamazoonensis TaxID=861299 RepID=W0RP44_9BACT|nr:ADOP family duplicated permease [Gemmatirosa kalamazoonensis]AHG92769.1 permease [Gemmatirosa kalamazoonensis]
MLRRFLVRARALVRHARTETELDEELRYHLERDAERLMRRGLSAEDARRVARHEFGDVEAHKEDVRDVWRVHRLADAQRDVRFALRSFRRAPAFVATVVLTIALALGLNTTAFTIFDAYVLRPIAVRDPFSLYELGWVDRMGHGHAFTWTGYEAARALPVATAAFAYQRVATRIDGRPLFGAATTGDALGILGATTVLGRTLVPEDAEPPVGAPVMVLSYDTWRAHFGGDSSIVGRRLLVRGIALTVVGVLDKGFGGISAVPPDFWVPITLASRLTGAPDLFGPKGEPSLTVVLRLRPGRSDADARATLAPFVARLTHDNPDSLRAVGAELTSIASAMPRNAETIAMFAPILTAFALVLLIACANVMNVMLARALARQREIGIRLTLGAGRGRLVAQLLTESALLALPAAVLGFLLSRWSIDAGVRVMFATMPQEFVPYMRVVPLAPDTRVFLFLLAAALGSALLFGLVPALQATRPSVVQAARGNFENEFRPGRLRSALVVGQITVCALLLIATGVLLRGAQKARHLETGMRTAHGVQVALDDRSRAPALDVLRRDAGVLELAGSVSAPLDGSYPTTPMRALGERPLAQTAYDFVSGGYFPVLGIPIVRGRTFTDAEERAGAAVAVVSAATARRLWPGRDPIGQHVQLGAEPTAGSRLARVRTAEVIGVAGDAVSGWIGTGLDRPLVYFPVSVDAPGVRVLARVAGDATYARERLDREISGVVPGGVDEIHTMDDYLAVQRYPFHAFSMVSGAIGAIALLLTVLGTYGVLSYLVAQRTREIGIRMALGAAARGVVGGVLGQSLRLAAVGLGAGVVLAIAVSHLFESVLVIVNTFDAAGYVGGAAVVLLSCLAAAYAPARRAARVDPMRVLRNE